MVCRIFETFAGIHYCFFCIGKHIPQWNTRIQVGISNPKKKNMKDFGKDKNGKLDIIVNINSTYCSYLEGNTGVHYEPKASGDSQKAPDLGSIFDPFKPPNDSNQGAGRNNPRSVYKKNIASKTLCSFYFISRRPHHAKHGDKPIN